MVLVVAQHNVPKPRTDPGGAMTLPALKLRFANFELRDHSLLRSDPPDDESSGGELPTEVRETQECKGLHGCSQAVSTSPAPIQYALRAACP